MKKASLTIALFSLVLVATSFAAPQKSVPTNATITFTDGHGSQSTGGNRKVDYNGGTNKFNQTTKVTFTDGHGSQSTGGNRKVD
jgi:hypothetical protein